MFNYILISFFIFLGLLLNMIGKKSDIVEGGAWRNLRRNSKKVCMNTNPISGKTYQSVC